MYWFKELSVQKDGEKKSFISFQPGLNLILGPSDTGKTLIFQCLDFLLGASELPKSPLPSYDSVDAVLSTNDGSLSISRSSKAARSELCVANQGEKYPYKQIGAFWFKLLGLSNPDIQVIGQSNGKREKLSWRKIVKLFVVRNQRFLSDSILTSEIFATPVNIRALFLYLLTQNNFECQRSSQEANLQNAERSGRLKRTKDLIEKLREELQNLPDYPESLEELQAQVADELAKLNRELVERRQEIRNFNRQLYANEREIAQKSLSLRNYDALDEQYEADLRRLNLIFEGEFHSSRDQAKGRCPLCESEIEGFGADAQPDAADARFDPQKLTIFIGPKSQAGYGQGYCSFLNVALSLAFARFLKKSGGNVPNVLIFDSPLTPLSEELQTAESRSLQRELLHFLHEVAVEDGFQIIVTDGIDKKSLFRRSFSRRLTSSNFAARTRKARNAEAFCPTLPFPTLPTPNASRRFIENCVKRLFPTRCRKPPGRVSFARTRRGPRFFGKRR
ncbi:MAG: AAA family ATPase [Thermoguttaceae bacterium]|nr:AAA family ATPase [Thermoguttaceae bacterium]